MAHGTWPSQDFPQTMHVSGSTGRTEKAREMIEGSRIRDSFGDPESPGASGHGSLPSGNLLHSYTLVN